MRSEGMDICSNREANQQRGWPHMLGWSTAEKGVREE